MESTLAAQARVVRLERTDWQRSTDDPWRVRRNYWRPAGYCRARAVLWGLARTETSRQKVRSSQISVSDRLKLESRCRGRPACLRTPHAVTIGCHNSCCGTPMAIAVAA